METIAAKSWLTIVLASAFFIFFKLGDLDLLDPDQGMWGDIGQEMAEGGDWVTPHFNGVRYLEKPPLYFWITAAAARLFGPSEAVVRLGSAAAALATALLTYRLGRLFYGATAALTAALALLSSLGTARYARQPAPDFLLVFSITLALYAFAKSGPLRAPAQAGESPPDAGWKLSLWFYVGAALAVLSKGLIGIVFPLAIVGLFLLLSRERPARRQLNVVKGLAVFLLIALPWHLLAAWKNAGFVWFYLVDNQFLRFLNRRAYLEDDVSLTTLGFLGNVLLWMFPWSFVVPAALREAVPQWRFLADRKERVRLFIGAWIFTVLGFFCLSSSKLEHYYLPALVPLSLLAGKLFGDAIDSGEPSKTLKWSLAASAALFAACGGTLMWIGLGLTRDRLLAALAQVDVYYRSVWTHDFEFPVASVSSFAPIVTALGIILIVGFPLAYALVRARRPAAAFTALVFVAVLVGLSALRVIRLLQPMQSAKPAAVAISKASRPDDAVVFEGDLSYGGGIPYYTGRRVYVLNGRRGDLEFGSYYPEASHLFLDDRSTLGLWRSGRRIFLVTRFSGDRSFIRQLPESALFAVGRYGPFWIYSNRPTDDGSARSAQ